MDVFYETNSNLFHTKRGDRFILLYVQVQTPYRAVANNYEIAIQSWNFLYSTKFNFLLYFIITLKTLKREYILNVTLV